MKIILCENAKPTVESGDIVHKCAAGCFLCGGAGLIGRSDEAQGWYRLRKSILEGARGNMELARDQLDKAQRIYDSRQRGQVRDSMGRALDRVSQFRVR